MIDNFKTLLESILANAELAEGQADGEVNIVTAKDGRYLFHAQRTVLKGLALLADYDKIDVPEIFRRAVGWYGPYLEEDMPHWRALEGATPEQVAGVLLNEVVGAYAQRRLDELRGLFDLAHARPESMAQC